MTPNLYAEPRYWSPRDGEPAMRALIAREGARIVRERMMPLLTGDAVQFHVCCADGSYWFANPTVSVDGIQSREGYQWFRSAASNYVAGAPEGYRGRSASQS